MQESVFLKADVNESGFQPIFQVFDLAFENTANKAFVGGAFDSELFELPIFEHSYTSLQRFGINDHFLVDALYWLNQALDLPDDLVGGEADGFNNALWFGIRNCNG